MGYARRILAALGLFLTLAAAPVVAQDYPMLELKNDQVTMALYLPDAENGFYRGTRFDWSGIIARVEYKGHTFYGPWRTPHDPTGHDFVSGPAEEFGMDNPSGFSEVEEGGAFVKVGVGLLRKSGSRYRFHGEYEIIRSGEWSIEKGPDWVEFFQDFTGEREWAYRYTKRIELSGDRPGFTISHRLENSGGKRIDINHYNHNFTLIDAVPYGPDYTVTLPFSTEEPREIKAKYADFVEDRIVVHQPLEDNSLWTQLQTGVGPADYNAATIRCNATGAAVKFKGNAPIMKYNFWSVATAACPEPFVHIDIEPGGVQEWAIDYTLMVDGDD